MAEIPKIKMEGVTKGSRLEKYIQEFNEALDVSYSILGLFKEGEPLTLDAYQSLVGGEFEQGVGKKPATSMDGIFELSRIDRAVFEDPGIEHEVRAKFAVEAKKLMDDLAGEIEPISQAAKAEQAAIDEAVDKSKRNVFERVRDAVVGAVGGAVSAVKSAIGGNKDAKAAAELKPFERPTPEQFAAQMERMDKQTGQGSKMSQIGQKLKKGLEAVKGSTGKHGEKAAGKEHETSGPDVPTR